MGSLVCREDSQLIDLVQSPSSQDPVKTIDEAIKRLPQNEQLAYCENVLSAINEAGNRAAYIAHHVLEYMSRHLLNEIDQTWANYETDLQRKYPTPDATTATQ